ncbi:MAG: hypothetical protein M3256_05155 [Actinomycetota bacterium]|nr:hypothetical protein [Actinomycetota bacterium]
MVRHRLAGEAGVGRSTPSSLPVTGRRQASSCLLRRAMPPQAARDHKPKSQGQPHVFIQRSLPSLGISISAMKGTSVTGEKPAPLAIVVVVVRVCRRWIEKAGCHAAARTPRQV